MTFFPQIITTIILSWHVVVAFSAQSLPTYEKLKVKPDARRSDVGVAG